MKELQMCDLKSQYQKIKPEIDAAIQRVIDSTAFIKGPEVKLFEDELASYLGVKHVIGCANGTDALQVALMALNLKPGDEVITTDFTFIATVEVVGLLGLKPIIVDVDPDTFCINLNAVSKAITSKTKAIVPVHLFGQNCNMVELMRIAESKNIAVVEDCAQSLGADYFWPCGTSKKSGTIGDIGCTSFFPSKNLGCFGDGGALYTNNDELAEKIRKICNHGMKIRYYYETLGVNSRLDTLQAAILRVKLKYLDQYNKARTAAADYYDNALKNLTGIQTPVRFEKSTHIFHQYTLVIKNGKRDALKIFLENKGIPVMVYYPFPLHSQKTFEYLNLHDDDYMVTNQLCEKVLSLPMHTEFDVEQLQYITEAIKEFYK